MILANIHTIGGSQDGQCRAASSWSVKRRLTYESLIDDKSQLAFAQGIRTVTAPPSPTSVEGLKYLDIRLSPSSKEALPVVSLWTRLYNKDHPYMVLSRLCNKYCRIIGPVEGSSFGIKIRLLGGTIFSSSSDDGQYRVCFLMAFLLIWSAAMPYDTDEYYN